MTTTRMSGAAELVLGRLVQRRQELAHHNLRACEVAAEILAAMREAAWGHVPALRADRQVRFREAQLAGERGMPVEDRVAIGHESPEGRTVALVGLRVEAGSYEHALVPLRSMPVAIAEAAALKQEADGPVNIAVMRALEGDGRIDSDEAAKIRRLLERCKHSVEVLEAALVQVELAHAQKGGQP